MLGSALVPALIDAGHSVTATDIRREHEFPWGGDGPRIEKLDVRSRAAVESWVARCAPDLVAHLAAETDLETCELDPDYAFATNSEGTLHVAWAVEAAGARMVYISTAGVFDGTKEGPYTEDDPPNPINVYGESKRRGELLVEQLVSRHQIVRAGWMVGGGDRDHKFVAKILNQLRAGARTIYAVGDKLGTPTYAPDFSRCLNGLIERAEGGLYHMACQGRCSRYDVAKKIVAALGLESHVQVVEVTSDFFDEQFPAPRPRSEMMLNARLERLGLNTMRPWETALDEYLQSAFADLEFENTAIA
jgi:dTDP-4-dehydrorhamnose reductase